MKLKSNLLHLDGLGGLFVGFLLLIFHDWLTTLYNLPEQIVWFVCIANLVYGTYSTFLAFMKKRPITLIKVIAFANFSWTFVCIYITVTYIDTISLFGILQVMGEGLYVSWLAFHEWKWKEDLILGR